MAGFNFKDSGLIVTVIVCGALFLDNMLRSTMLPVLPVYIYETIENQTYIGSTAFNSTNGRNCTDETILREEGVYIGILFAVHPIFKIISSLPVGILTSKVGYDVTMIAGYITIILSALLFGLGGSYALLMIASAFHGIASALIHTSGLGIVSTHFIDYEMRSKMIGVALASTVLGELIGPTFGSVTYQFIGISMPFSTIAVTTLLMLIVHVLGRSISFVSVVQEGDRSGYFTLLKEIHIWLCITSLFVVTISYGVLETGQATWVMKKMCPEKWMIGVSYISESVFYIMTVVCLPHCILTNKRWIALGCGISLVGLSSIAIPFSPSIWLMLIPEGFWGTGYGVVETAVYPLIGELVYNKRIATYGHGYALADFTINLAFAISPLLTALLVPLFSFEALMISVGVLTIAFASTSFFFHHKENKYHLDLEGLVANDGENRVATIS